MTSSYTVFRPGERKKRSKDDEDEEVEKEIRAGARTAYDAQRARLERLMKVCLFFFGLSKSYLDVRAKL